MAVERKRHLGLLGRIALALIAVGAVPLAVGLIPAVGANRQAMFRQILHTHSVAARSLSQRLSAMVDNRRAMASSLAGNSLLLDRPGEAAAQEVLRAMLATQPNIAAVVLESGDGEEILRAQRPGANDLVNGLLERRPGQPTLLTSDQGALWLRLRLPFADRPGTLTLIDDVSSLASELQPEDVGDQARLAILDQTGEVILGGIAEAEIPASVRNVLELGVSMGGAQRTEDHSGRPILAAHDPVAGTPWTILSMQPAATADRLTRAMRRSALLAFGTALSLATLLIWLAFRSLVRPIRGMLAAQRELAGQPSGGGSEIEELQESFATLTRRIRDRQDLGRVFLGRYQVSELLGEGAMGSVFRGWDPILHRQVALKTVRLDAAADPTHRKTLLETLLREGIAAAQLSHPNLVSVFDAFAAPDAAYIAMEFVDGVGLDRVLLEAKRLSAAQVASLGIAVARALRAAHDVQIVHRDIKPPNILLGYDLSIKVADFGIADFLSRLAPEPDRVFGTPGYVAPEVLRGGAYQTASDLFSLGVVLYESITGANPFQAASVGRILLNTLKITPRPIVELQPSVPTDLAEIVEGLLHKNPGQRPADAGALAEQLATLQTQHGWSWSLPDAIAQAPAPPGPLSPSGQWIPTQPVDTLPA